MLLENKVVEFYAILLLCDDYHIMLECYSDIDDLRKDDDFNALIGEYYPLADKLINFNKV